MFGSFLQEQKFAQELSTTHLVLHTPIKSDLRLSNNGSGPCRHEAVVLYGFTHAHLV